MSANEKIINIELDEPLLNQISCTECQNTVTDLAKLKGKMLVCSRCQAHGSITHYCSRECQKLNFKTHKSICGPLSTPPQILKPLQPLPLPSEVPKSLQTQLDFLNKNPEYSYLLLRPSLPLPKPFPVSLPTSTLPLYRQLLLTAIKGNSLSLELLFSLLLDAVLEMGGKESDLINQLSDEFGIELGRLLEEDREPDEEELSEAIGGDLGLLLEWQMSEAARSR